MFVFIFVLFAPGSLIAWNELRLRTGLEHPTYGEAAGFRRARPEICVDGEL
jgi:hypothetical protein